MDQGIARKVHVSHIGEKHCVLGVGTNEKRNKLLISILNEDLGLGSEEVFVSLKCANLSDVRGRRLESRKSSRDRFGRSQLLQETKTGNNVRFSAWPGVVNV